MAGVGLLALLDDIATVLDDVAVLTKVATKKTVGVLGDDLALNAQQVSGVRAEREIPVVWAVAKGSALNKVILVPLALIISAIAPWAITPLLMCGGIFLCFEGFEKVFHALFHANDKLSREDKEALHGALVDQNVDLVAFEQRKIKGAIRTDFILSAEIIVIALGSVQGADLVTQLAVLVTVAALITIAVYSLVAGIVKLDDAGLYLQSSLREGLRGRVQRQVGRWLLSSCPYLMKTLSVVGTAAMFLVGGGILLHGLPHDWVDYLSTHFTTDSVVLSSLLLQLVNAAVGICLGGLAVLVVTLAKSMRS